MCNKQFMVASAGKTGSYCLQSTMHLQGGTAAYNACMPCMHQGDACELTIVVRRSVRMSVDALGRELYTRSLTTRCMAASPAETSLLVSPGFLEMAS